MKRRSPAAKAKVAMRMAARTKKTPTRMTPMKKVVRRKSRTEKAPTMMAKRMTKIPTQTTPNLAS